MLFVCLITEHKLSTTRQLSTSRSVNVSIVLAFKRGINMLHSSVEIHIRKMKK